LLVGLELLPGSEDFPKPIFHSTDFWLKLLVAFVFFGWFFSRGQDWKPDQIGSGGRASRVGFGNMKV
jgi:hypothetical protein